MTWAARSPTMAGMPIRPTSILLAAVAALAACRTPPPAPVFHGSPPEALQALPFSEAVAANGFLFVAGQVGNLPGTLQLPPGGIEAEAKQALANLVAVLERHGCTTRDVVKCTVFLVDIAEWPAFNAAYRQVFAAPFPARSALAASGLALGARVEIECIAALPAPR